MQYAIKTKLAPVQFILSIMEIEAWFLSEHMHFPKIDPAITAAAIHGALGFNPMADDMSDRPAPADDMIAAYQLGGKTYTKGSADGTIHALDYDHVYMGLRDRIPDLNDLLTSIDTFLA
ncbi:hypothetical protein WS75_22790 [Burkholderia sp. FL-7-2-10-S1-D7]|nr:hypothetical protein WS75_22790 [Burkholderia sp. FL-7-2-10-S1-D7]